MEENETSWAGQSANNAKVGESIPVWVIHFSAGLNDPCGPLPTKNIVLFYEMYLGTIFCCHHIYLWHSVSEVEAIAEATGFVLIFSYLLLAVFVLHLCIAYQRLQPGFTKVMANLDWETVKSTGINVTRIWSFSGDTTPAADHTSIWNSLGDRVQCPYLLWVYKKKHEKHRQLSKLPQLSQILLHQWSRYSLIILKRSDKSYQEYPYFWKAALTFKT